MTTICKTIIMEQENSILVEVFTRPKERAKALESIRRSKETHIGSEFREMMRFATMMSMLSLGLPDKEIKKRLEEFDAAQAAMDRVNGPPVEIDLDQLKAVKETLEVDPYSPCPCESGKKYKFCCYLK